MIGTLLCIFGFHKYSDWSRTMWEDKPVWENTDSRICKRIWCTAQQFRPTKESDNESTG